MLFMRLVCVLTVLLIAVLLYIAHEEGTTNANCRINGGVPVKTDYGYTCIRLSK